MKQRRIALLGVLAVLVTVWVWAAAAPPRAATPVIGTTATAIAQSTPAPAPRTNARDTNARGARARNGKAPTTNDFDLDQATARLKARLASAPAPRSPERNPFDFEHPPAPTHAPVAPVTRAIGAPPLPAGPPPPPQVTLSGIAERKTGEGLVRTAIINGPGQLYFARIGERVAGRYEVTAIGVDIVELKDLNDATRLLRLTLR